MNFEQARYNMVESQIRTWEVIDQDVLDLLFVVKREDFVPPQYRTLAFVDMQIPLGYGEFMLPAKLEARILQELELKKIDTVLEIGTGSGYLTALLAHRSRHVTSIEIIPEFSEQTQHKLANVGISNVALEIGDGASGWSRSAPYDAIVLTGSLPMLPDVFLEHLKPSGRLFAVLGDAPAMQATLITRSRPSVFSTVNFFETNIAPLRNALQPKRFVF